MSKTTRTVEFYRLWDGSGLGVGQWDTDTIEIPIDTPEDKVDAAIRKAADAIQWRDGNAPIIVGFYAEASDPEESDLNGG